MTEMIDPDFGILEFPRNPDDKSTDALINPNPHYIIEFTNGKLKCKCGAVFKKELPNHPSPLDDFTEHSQNHHFRNKSKNILKINQ